MVTGILSWIAWDIVVAANATSGDTVSEILLYAATRFTVVPLAAGTLCGHWFWPVRKIEVGVWRYWALGGVGALALGLDYWAPFISIFPVIPFVIGFFLGHWLWPQKRIRGT
jgi:hypothetical protein